MSMSEATACSLAGFCVGYDSDVVGARERNAVGGWIWEAGPVTGAAEDRSAILNRSSRMVVD